MLERVSMNDSYHNYGQVIIEHFTNHISSRIRTVNEHEEIGKHEHYIVVEFSDRVNLFRPNTAP